MGLLAWIIVAFVGWIMVGAILRALPSHSPVLVSLVMLAHSQVNFEKGPDTTGPFLVLP